MSDTPTLPAGSRTRWSCACGQKGDSIESFNVHTTKCAMDIFTLLRWKVCAYTEPSDDTIPREEPA